MTRRLPACALLMFAVTAMAQNNPNAIPDVGIDQKLNAQIPLDLSFTDSTGKQVILSDYFNEKPVILTLVYYECPMLCTQVLNGFVRSLRAMSFSAGGEFDVLTISIDPDESRELAAGKKKTYLNKYVRDGAEEGWHFLTGDEAAVKAVADAVGFRYSYDAKTDLYAHASGIMVLTPEGRVSKYFYGIEYSPRDLKLALMEASDRRIGSAVDQLLLLCFHYDPTTGKYGLAIMNLIRVLSLLTVASLGTFIVRMLRRDYVAVVPEDATPDRREGGSDVA